MRVLILFIFSSIIFFSFIIPEDYSFILKESKRLNKTDSLEIVIMDSSMNDKDFPSIYFKIEGKSNSQVSNYVYFGRVNTCRNGGCDKPSNSILSSSEYFDYLIFFDSNAVVKSIKIIDYQATHGQEICSKSWLNQFKDYSIQNEIRVGKEIDAISGATISTYAITQDIIMRSKYLIEFLRK